MNDLDRTCKCDAGWTDHDCSRRMCPRSNDVMDERENLEDERLVQLQNFTLYSGGPSGIYLSNRLSGERERSHTDVCPSNRPGNGTASAISDFQNGSFAITFVSLLNETYTTYPLRLSNSSDYTEVEVRGASILSFLPTNVHTSV